MAEGPSSSGVDLDDIGEQLRSALMLETVREEGFGNFLRERAWAAALWLAFLWLIITPVIFALVGVVIGSFTGAVILAPILGLAAVGAIARWRGYDEPIDEARETAPLWVRLIVPIPVFVFVAILFFVGVGAVIQDFLIVALIVLVLAAATTAGFVWLLGLWRDVPERTTSSPIWLRVPVLPTVLFAALFGVFFMALGPTIPDFRVLLVVDTVGALATTGVIVWATGLWHDVPGRVRDSGPPERLAALAVIGVLAGLVGFFVGLLLLEEVAIALAIFLPAMIAGIVAAALGLGWADDAHQAIVDWHFGIRIGAFVVLLTLVTLYFALLIGPFLPNALVGYGIALVIAAALLVPLSVWVRTWRDLWTTFVDMGEDRRLVATLPILPLSALAVFAIIVVTTSMFDLAYAVSIPAGVAIFLLAGIPFGVTQDIPRVVRGLDLPRRTAVFLTFFLLTTLYAYFAIALFVQDVEISIVAGMAFAGLLLGLLVHQFDLDEGLGDEFESYGGPAEAAVLGGVFVVTLVVSFLLIALTIGDFRIAFLVSVLLAAGANYLVAHTTGFVEGTREALAELPWWAELGVLSAVFVLAYLYGVIAIGSFIPGVALSLALGALLALAAVAALSHDLEIGEEIMHTADEKKRARSAILVLGFIGGFLVGLYAAAGALGAVGVDLFGFPFFIALLAGVGAVIALSRRRGWDEDVVANVRTTTDKLKVGVILVLWLGLSIFTGFALQALPIQGPIAGIGDPSGLPLTITLAAGLILWAWLPVLLFRLVRVERTPVDATVSAPEKRKALASLGWGLLVFAVVLVVMLTVLDNTVIGVGVALAAGYLTALAFSTRRGRGSTDS